MGALQQLDCERHTQGIGVGIQEKPHMLMGHPSEERPLSRKNALPVGSTGEEQSKFGQQQLNPPRWKAGQGY